MLIACPEHHSLAIDINGTLWAWGDNTNGQLGDGDSGADTNVTAPKIIQRSNNFQSC